MSNAHVRICGPSGFTWDPVKGAWVRNTAASGGTAPPAATQQNIASQAPQQSPYGQSPYGGYPPPSPYGQSPYGYPPPSPYGYPPSPYGLQPPYANPYALPSYGYMDPSMMYGLGGMGGGYGMGGGVMGMGPSPYGY